MDAPEQRKNAPEDGAESSPFVIMGRGSGLSKKIAKLEAAKDALATLVPGLTFDQDYVVLAGNNTDNGENAKTEPTNNSVDKDSVYRVFDLMKVTDFRVSELSVKAGQPHPYLVLQVINY